MDVAHGSHWMARLRVGLAALALMAACRCGEPTTTSGPPANGPGPDAAEPRWSVEIVEPPPLATYPALDIRAVYPDRDVLVVPPEERTAQMALERRGPGGVLRWRTTWKDHRDFHVAVTARDTWVLALGERPLRVSPRTQLAIDDPGPNPLVLARLRSADGVIEATTVLVPHIPIEERRDGLLGGFLLPHDDGVVVSAPGPDVGPLRKFNRDLALVATVPVPEGTVHALAGAEVSTRGEVCLRFDRWRPAHGDPAMWCLDPNLADGHIVSYPEGAYEVWHDGPRIVGWRTEGPVSGYRVDVTIADAPPLIIESVCRWLDERSFWDSFLSDCDHDCPPPPCLDTKIFPFGMQVDDGIASLMFDIGAPVSIAGHKIDVARETIAVLALGPGPRARLQLYPGCSSVRAWVRSDSDGRILIHCPRVTQLRSTK